MNYRNTWQKNRIYQEIETKGHISTEELILNLDNEKISVATIYRNLKILQEEHRIKPIRCTNRILYETIKHNHYHFECLECHRVFDIDANLVSLKIDRSITEEVSKKEVFLYGICKYCQKAKEENN